ncbi:chymotrypsin-like elastase family member 2A [Hydractinia symbiolongicarpus]|uniref:chymotrypsin-like elastase family member 2A n=1 Tax=Hydractinia symbiolongicarpus TaxID=13093 RepID=UPI00254AE44A|nr:chymotrypsin-like elastase family member 2A [Hydractinia symbiolongicarpus]
MKSFLFLTIFILVQDSLAQSCRDNSGEYYCKIWSDSDSNFCNRIDAHLYCEKTCSLCPVVSTARPTAEPITSTEAPRSCGKSTVQQSRIINGVNAQPGAWPWIASLQKYHKHFCGATLLTPTWVLTASHCVESISSYDDWSIKLGAHDHRVSEPTVQRMKIKRIIMHPKYSRSTLKADMAMVELSSPARLNDRVALACLPKKDQYPSLGKKCYLAGWGSVAHPGGVYHTLQQVRLPVVESTECKYNDEVVCVGKGKTPQPSGKQQPNACRGDSGGPLVCQQSDGRWQLEGVASFVYTYCKYYTGYSPVNKYLDWINGYLMS